MFVVTNRRIHSGKSGLDQFDKQPNEKGPNELRIFEAKKQRRGWKVAVLGDTLTQAQKREVSLPVSKPAYASSYVAKKVLKRVRSGRRDLVFFVHGFNNDVESVLERAHGFETTYGVEVVAFSWPANGGGAKGAISYKSDKRDARASAGAVYRAMARTRELLNDENEKTLADIQTKAAAKFPDNMELRDQHVSDLAERACRFKLSLVCHSMGNYLYKQIQSSSIFDGHHMLFDNVVLVAADTNNEGHARWVDRIRCRKRVFIVINENDRALLASRIKSGEEQQARLGHYLHGLNSEQALYVDVTNAPSVKKDHAYFEGAPVRSRGGKLYRFFHDAFHGEPAEQNLVYREETKTWRVR